MENFPGNSKNPIGDNKPPKPEKVIETVVTTPAVIRQKSFGRQLKGIFQGSRFKAAANYVVNEVLVPAFLNMFVDSVSRGAERFAYGDAPRRRYETGRPRVRYDSPPERYSRPANRGMLPDQPPLSGVPRRRQDIGDIVIYSREEAERVIERLNDIIDQYDVATVGDLHSLVELPSTYVDEKWGWRVLNYASVRQIREGFLLDLPPVEPL